MRWENLTEEAGRGRAGTSLFGADAVTTRTFDTPEPRWYQRRITRQVHEPARECGIGRAHAGTPRRIPVPADEPELPEPIRLTLL